VKESDIHNNVYLYIKLKHLNTSISLLSLQDEKNLGSPKKRSLLGLALWA